MVNYDTELAKWKQAIHDIESPDMKANIMAKLATKKPKHGKARRTAVYAAAILVTLLLTSGVVMAVGGISFEELMEKLKSPFAELLQPTLATCEDQGIRMEMTAMGHSDQMAMFYITVKDMEGNRIDENIRFTSYSIPSQWGSSGGGGSGLEDYDAEKGIAIFSFTANTSETFDGKPFTFVGKELAYNMREWRECPVDTDLTQANNNPETITLVLWDTMSGSASSDMYDENNRAYVLKPNQQIFDFPEIDFAKVTGIGIVNGKLHVQFWQDPGLCEYDEARPYLKKANADGTFSESELDPVSYTYTDRVYADQTAYFETDVAGDLIPVIDGVLAEDTDLYYIEYVFDVNIEDLAQYGLFADFKKYDLLQGQWILEWQQEKTLATIDMDCDVSINGDIPLRTS